MLPSIRRSPASIADLEEIWQFIARDSEAFADKWIGLIDSSIHSLAAHNQLGKSRPELPANLHSFPVKDYVIFYRPITSGGIDVVRVLHSSRDIRPEIFE